MTEQEMEAQVAECRKIIAEQKQKIKDIKEQYVNDNIPHKTGDVAVKQVTDWRGNVLKEEKLCLSNIEQTFMTIFTFRKFKKDGTVGKNTCTIYGDDKLDWTGEHVDLED